MPCFRAKSRSGKASWGQQAHPEGFGSHGHASADASQADQAQRLLAKGQRRPSHPQAPVDFVVSPDQKTAHCQQQRHRMLCHRLVVGGGGDGDDHVVTGHGLQVDAVNPHSPAGNHSQVGQGSHHPPAVRLSAGEGRRDALQHLDGFLLVGEIRLGGKADGQPGLPQQVQMEAGTVLQRLDEDHYGRHRGTS